MTASFLIEPINKPGLLVAIMRAFAGPGTEISLEGDLTNYPLQGLEQASHSERPYLKRNTLSPIQDFVVAPLTPHNIALVTQCVSVKDGLSKNSGIIHVQVAKAAVLVFGGYDNFHPDCVFCTDAVSTEQLQSLVEHHVIRSFHPARA